MLSNLTTLNDLRDEGLGQVKPGDWISLARQGWMKFHLPSVQHVLQHVEAQTTLLEDILRDEGLGHVKHWSDRDLLSQAGLDEVPLVLRTTRSSARGCPDHLPSRHPS